MRIAYFEPFSGASGDMILGSLVDSGLSINVLRQELEKVPLTGYEIATTPVTRHGLTGYRVEVSVENDQPARDWAAIRELLTASDLDEPVKSRALAIFERLAQAEAKVHGTPVESVHFHEVGGVDAIVDVCGAAIGLHAMGVEAVFSGPLQLGQGYVQTQHGLLPVPAPATAELLAQVRAPTSNPPPSDQPVNAELLTPTGAAILTTLAEFRRPPFAPSAIGYGFGTIELPWPNALRVWIGDS